MFFLSSGGKNRLQLQSDVNDDCSRCKLFLMLYFVVVIFKGFVIIFRFPEIILPLIFGV